MPEPFLSFDGKRIVVTGASSGIGRAVAVELARNGARLALIGRNQARLEETAAEIADPRTVLLSFDLASTAEIGPRVKGLAEGGDRVYGLCHCAGVVETRPLSSCKVEGIEAMMAVNVSAGIELARAVCRRDVMEEAGGAILFMSSIYGHVGMPGQIGYTASKGAIAAAARAMAMELAPRKIRVNTVSPGLVRTAMIEESFAKLSEEQVRKIESSFPLGIGQLSDVAKAACFLLAPQSRWITGIDLVIDGGYTAQ